jgi:hypothetical protein
MRPFEVELEVERIETVEEMSKADEEIGYRASHKEYKALYASGSISSDSPRGVRFGSQLKDGMIASSNTESRPDWMRILVGSFGRNKDVMARPRVRMWVLLSSRRVSRGGIKRAQCCFMISSCHRRL